MLSGTDLRDELESGRLIISPPLADLDNLGVAIDLTLHNVFWRSTPPDIEEVDVVIGLNADPYEWMRPETFDELVLQPREFVLAETAEALGVPLDLCGWIEGKSGRARLGLEVHLTAPRIDPGWGIPTPKRITLEIVNHNHVKIRLRAGAPIAQVVFHRLGMPATEPYSGRHGGKGTWPLLEQLTLRGAFQGARPRLTLRLLQIHRTPRSRLTDRGCRLAQIEQVQRKRPGTLDNAEGNGSTTAGRRVAGCTGPMNPLPGLLPIRNLHALLAASQAPGPATRSGLGAEGACYAVFGPLAQPPLYDSAP